MSFKAIVTASSLCMGQRMELCVCEDNAVLELKCIVHFSLLTWNHLDYTNQLKSSVNLDLKNISGISNMLS